MDVTLGIIIMLGYNLLLLELLTIAAMAWRYNGRATNGTGKLLGPFAFILGSVIMRVNVSVVLMVFHSQFTETIAWQLIGIAQLWGAVVFGGFICEHMIGQIRRNGRVTL